MKINLVVLGGLLCSVIGCNNIAFPECGQYKYSSAVYNFSNQEGQILQSGNICQTGGSLSRMLFPYSAGWVHDYYYRPYNKIYATWTYSSPEESSEAIIPIKLPKEFTPYDGRALIFCFDGKEVWMAYSYYYGSPEPYEALSSEEDLSKVEKILLRKAHNRISRKFKTILEDGTPFDPNEYMKYKKVNNSGTLVEFLKSKEK